MDVERLRLAVYGSFATTGRAPSADDLAAELDISLADVADGLQVLAGQRHLALDEQGQVVMAHPFSAVPLGFAVMGQRTLWWGGCAWDSFAVPHLVADEPEVLVSTSCPACGRPHVWVVNRAGPPDGYQVAHFLVPAARMWDDVVHTCGNQRIFCCAGCVDAWLTRTGNTRGFEMDLTTLWHLAEHWYDGRISPGYVRRDPAQSAQYLNAVGLTGPFWAS